MVRIAVLISGSGSNLQSLIDACNEKTINGQIVLNDTLDNIYQTYNSNDLEDIFFELYKKEVGDLEC